MNFLEDMAGKEVSGMLANSSNPLASSVMQMINNQPGGAFRTAAAISRQRSRRPGYFLGRHGPEPSHFRRSAAASFGQRTGKGIGGQGGNFARCSQLSHLAQLLPMLVDKLHAQRTSSTELTAAGRRNGHAEKSGTGQDRHGCVIQDRYRKGKSSKVQLTKP